MPIALLKFPSDLLREVFKLCEPYELYALSKCSKRTQRSIKLRGTKNWKIVYFSGGQVIISVDGSWHYFNRTFYPDEYFKMKYSQIEFPSGGSADLFFLFHRHFWDSHRSNAGEHQFTKYPNQISIHRSSWFNIGHLLECTCVRIELSGSMRSNQDLNVFLQKWKKTGAFPNLQFLKIKGNKIDNKSPILEMIPQIKIVGNATIRRSFVKDELLRLGGDDIDNAVQVTKDDGTVGWLTVELRETPTLKFLT
ncbi:hypothetical protein L5515_010485 [Caenorhabditis briggsae]|uniref:F-box domain-containing protein n=1 Tax=Caenorhabditis briggsae TaxID=6238 RepID=A0AAE9EQD0_CAEBR|nr:hypothetical protein L5515_010485 [Caenorhabditis briggsae]